MGISAIDLPAGLDILGATIFPRGTAKIFWVHSTTGSNSGPGYGETPDNPFASINHAFTQAVASRGDYIVALPGHVETVSAAAGLDADAAGVTVLGLGEGSLRPTVNFTTAATADMDVDAANITFVNLIFDATAFDGIDAPIDVNAADCTFRRCKFVVGDSGGQADDMIVTATAADRLKIIGCEADGGATTGPVSLIDIVGTPDGIEIVDNKIIGTFSGGVIDNETGNVATNILIARNYIKQDHATALVIDMDSAVTGMICDNRYYSAVDPATAGAQQIDGGACSCFENYGSDVADGTASGILEPSVLT